MDWDNIIKGGSKGGNGGEKPIINLPDIKIPKFKPSGVLLIIAIVLLVGLAASTVYIIEANEKGIVLRFGRYSRTTGPGVHFKMPSPIEQVYTPNVTTVRREEIGFRIIDQGPPARYRDIASESLMLTGDENIVDIDIVVQYRILDPVHYLFKVRKQRKAIRDASEAALREVIGSISIDEALTTGKFMIQKETRELAQMILDKYDSGFKIEAVQLQDVHPPKEVVSSFKDVASAKEDKNRLINESQGYRNSVIPEARGKVAQIINAAEAYREEKINMAKGDAAKFTKILNEYNKAKDVTKRRLYLETLEEILPDMQKFIIDGRSAPQILPFLSLDKFSKKRTGE